MNRTKKSGFLAVIIIAMTVVMTSAGFAADYSSRDYDSSRYLGLARVTYIEKDAIFSSQDSDDWAALSPNFTLREGDKLWAGDNSKIEVRFSGGNIAWMNFHTKMDIVRLVREGGAGVSVQLGLTSGDTIFRSQQMSGESVFQVDTASASIRAKGDALFRITVTDDDRTRVGVSEGEVDVETEDGLTTLWAGDMLEVSGSEGVSITGLGARDRWDNWVVARIGMLDRESGSARYLPGDLAEYANEFDTGGRWVKDRDYGNIWVPTVASDWSPYSNGIWVYQGGDYVWDSYDPWYAPFHFGRWGFSDSRGWYWVPPAIGESYWSPGYVSWTVGPDYMYWVPLAPQETYFGYGDYGRSSVNAYRSKSLGSKFTYANSRVRNGLVIIGRDDFMKGKYSRIREKKAGNPFTDSKLSRRGDFNLIFRPPVKEFNPAQTMRFPRPGSGIDKNSLPPVHVREEGGFLKRRELSRSEGQSVIRPGQQLRIFDRGDISRGGERQQRFQDRDGSQRGNGDDGRPGDLRRRDDVPKPVDERTYEDAQRDKRRREAQPDRRNDNPPRQQESIFDLLLPQPPTRQNDAQPDQRERRRDNQPRQLDDRNNQPQPQQPVQRERRRDNQPRQQDDRINQVQPQPPVRLNDVQPQPAPQIDPRRDRPGGRGNRQMQTEPQTQLPTAQPVDKNAVSPVDAKKPGGARVDGAAGKKDRRQPAPEAKPVDAQGTDAAKTQSEVAPDTQQQQQDYQLGTGGSLNRNPNNRQPVNTLPLQRRTIDDSK